MYFSSFPLKPLRLFTLVVVVLLLLCIGSCCCCETHESTPPPLPDRYLLRKGVLSGRSEPAPAAEAQEYFDPVHPPVFPDETPACSVRLLQHDFAHTYGSPPATAEYRPPDGCRWTHAVLEFSAACAGEQYDRIAAVWIDGVEVLRTSTAEPTESGVFWAVRKDVTRYSSLLAPRKDSIAGDGDGREGRRRLLDDSSRRVTVMLENVVDKLYTGIYHVNVSLDFFNRGGARSDPSARGKRGFLGEGENDSTESGGKLGNSSEKKDRCKKLKLSADGDDPIDLRDNDNEPLIQQLGKKRGKSPLKDPCQRYAEEKMARLLGKPADLIIPVSNEKGRDEGFWFRIQNEANVRYRTIRIPKNAYRAVLELYVSSHGDDEFWYSNPPDSYIQENNLPTKRGNGAFREVFATVDGLYAGSIIPFPVVFAGGINPLFWSPVVGIAAFDLPSYELDLTPFLGNLINGRPHKFGFGVSYGIPFWLVNANLHLWLDHRSVTARLVKHQASPTTVNHDSQSHRRDGLYKLEAERGAHFAGWVSSSLGNLTFLLQQQFKYRSTIGFKNAGTVKEVYSKSKLKTDVKIEEGLPGQQFLLARLFHKAKYPITVTTASVPGDGDSYIRTNLSHILYEKRAVTVNQVPSLSSIADAQTAEGWMQVQDHNVLGGSATTQQIYKRIVDDVCYTRMVGVQDGNVLDDQVSTDCVFNP